jgi:transposase
VSEWFEDRFMAQVDEVVSGRRSVSEKRQIVQLTLGPGASVAAVERVAPAQEPKPRTERKPGSPATGPGRWGGKPLPEHLRREVVTHAPDSHCCPDCGSQSRQFGEDVSEQLEYIAESFKVIRHVRPKYGCTGCDRVVEAAAPSRPIERGLAGPSLLAHVMVSKYADHLPLYRQSEIYARQGVEISRSTLAGWVGAASDLLSPLVDATQKHVLAGRKLRKRPDLPS